MAEISIAIALLFGLLIGLVAAFLGIGGGVLFVPTLIFIFGLDVKRAIGTSLMAVLITSVSSAIAYARKRKIDYKLGLVLEGASVPGAIAGAYFIHIAPEYLIRAIFTAFLMIMALDIFRAKKGKRTIKSDSRSSKIRIIYALLLAFVAGFLSASLGIGGGVLKVPIMVTVLNIPIHHAIGTSEFMIAITASAGFIQHLKYGYTDLYYGFTLGLGSALGAQVGAKFSLKTRPEILRKALGVLLFALGIRMMLTL